MTPTRPVLRYHGGKWRLAPWIIEHFPPHRVYVEPFGGAASVLLRKPRSYAEVYNDLDSDLVNVFRVLRDPVRARALKRLLELTPFARAEFNDAYEEQGSDDVVERARRCIVRAHMGYGSAAFNSQHGTGFRPYTGGDRHRLPSRDWSGLPEQIWRFVERLSGVIIEQRDAEQVMLAHDSANTLHYVDPPYVPETRGSAKGVRQKYRHDMTVAEHRALAKVLHALDGMVVLSGYPSPLYDKLYRKWRRVETTAMADGAHERTECLWLNPAAVAAGAIRQPSMFDSLDTAGPTRRRARNRRTERRADA